MMRRLYGVMEGSRVQLYVVAPIDEPMICDACGNGLGREVLHFYAKNIEPSEWVLCMNCARNPKNDYLRMARDPNLRVCLLVVELPHGAMPIVSPAEFMYRHTLNIIAKDDVPVRVVDRTRRAGRPGYTLDGTETIGKPIAQIEREAEKRFLTFEEADAFLDDLRDATPILPEKKDDWRLLE